MSDAQMHNKMDILTLPKHIPSNIGSWLNDQGSLQDGARQQDLL